MKEPASPSRAPQCVPLDLGPRSYDIAVGRGLLGQLGPELAARLPGAEGRTAVIISSPRIARHYEAAARQSLERAGFRVECLSLPAGERHKTLATVRRAYEFLHARAVDRRALVIALGGGVIGDMAGFIAATYGRGLDFVQVPTTLLAQVDSSVGGKTGVNFGPTKNLIGAFYQPRFVLIDPDTLRSLPPRERRSGLAEVIKYGIIDDRPFFDLLAREGPGLVTLTSAHLEHAIVRSCEIKARVVEQDEREGGLRAVLNFGHTIGHALEAVTQYRVYTHGEAISIGMVSAALIGEQAGVTRPEDTQAVAAVFQSVGLPVGLVRSLDLDEIVRLTAWDKKSVGGTARFVLMEELGRVTTGHVVPVQAVRAALERQRETYAA